MRRGTPDSDEALSRLIRRSRVLNSVAKQSWLRVLPHLSPADRARLRDILASEYTAPVPRPAPESELRP